MQNCLNQLSLLPLVSPVNLTLQDKKAKERLAATTESLMTLLNEVVIEKAAGPKSLTKCSPAFYGNIISGAIKEYLTSNSELINKIIQEKPSLLKKAQKIIDSAPIPSPKSSRGDSADSMAIAMMYLTAFQGEVSKLRSDQDMQDIQLQADNLSAAVDEQTHIANLVAEYNEEVAKAADVPWYEKMLKWVVPIVAVVVSFCTAGAGAAVAAALVGAFMASPLYGDMVSGISSAVSKALQAAGMPADKANAIGNIVGKITAAVVVAALTLGVGGASSLVNSARAAATEGAEVATSAASQYVKMAAFEFTASIGTSGIAQDALTAQHGSTWVEAHSSLMLGITITSTIIGIGATMYMGKVAFGGLKVTGNLLEKLPSIFRAFVPLTGFTQAAQGGVEAGLGFARAEIMKAEAETVEKIGVSQSEMSALASILDLITDTQTKNDSSANSNSKLLGSEMDAMKESAGKDWQTAASILA